jgi:hypothetical protein
MRTNDDAHTLNRPVVRHSKVRPAMSQWIMSARSRHRTHRAVAPPSPHHRAVGAPTATVAPPPNPPRADENSGSSDGGSLVAGERWRDRHSARIPEFP